MFFGGTIIDQSLQKGMNNMEKRLGADLMIVPEGAEEDASDMILEGARKNFYFNKSVYDDISKINGVGEATPQFYLKSLSADCCSSEVEIVFFDPGTDFIIQPWICKEYKQKIQNDMVVVGDSINVEDGGVLKLFGRDYKVAAKMAKTGTSLDKSVYFTFDSLEQVVLDAEEKGSILSENQKDTDLISSVYIKIENGYKTEDILKEIQSSAGENFEVVYPKQIAESLSKNLEGI
jgi:putative ABC transport system permease protein